MKASNHPTGLAGVAAGAIVIVASKLGLDLSAEEAAVIVAAVASVVSIFTPRTSAA